MKVKLYFGREDEDEEKAITPCLVYCGDSKTSENYIGRAIVLVWWDFGIGLAFFTKKTKGGRE